MTQAPNPEPEIDNYDDPDKLSADAPVPRWLFWSYILLPILGIAIFCLYWNGSAGWLDRGYWRQLQIAANTTVPFEDQDNPN